MPTPETHRYVREFVRRRAAIVVEDGKEYLIESRLLPITRRRYIPSIDELVAKVRADEGGELAREVIEAMTTNETSFFRDMYPFEALKTAILPELIRARASTRTLQIWCAASSTGQEPYSIAMCIREAFPELATWNVRILATDINASVLERARSGVYRQLEVNRGLPAPLLVKYFERVGADWRVKPTIRDMVSFQELNLLDRWPLFSPQDIVFMRNVLIYFDVATKKQLLGRVRESLRADGYLVLGGAETTINLDDGLVPMRSGPSIYYSVRAALDAKVANVHR